MTLNALKINSLQNQTIFGVSIGKDLASIIPYRLQQGLLKSINEVLEDKNTQKDLKGKNIQKINISINERGLILTGERPLAMDIRPALDVYRYLRRTGSFIENNRYKDELAGIYKAVIDQFTKRNEEIKPTLFGRCTPAPASLSDLSSVIRFGYSANSGIDLAHPYLLGLGVGGGALATISGLQIMKTAYEMYKISSKAEDTIGTTQAALLASIGGSLSALGVAFTVDKGYALFVNPQITTVFGAAIAPLYGLLSIGALGYGAYGLNKSIDFKEELQSYLNSGYDNSLEHTLSFLKDKLQVDKLEYEAIKKSIDNKNLSREAAARALEEELQKAFSRKRLQLERWTSPECVQYLVENIDEAFSNLQTNNTEKAKEIIQKVLDANFKKIFYYTMVTIAGVLGIVTAIISLILASPVLPALLMALTSIFWLIADTEFLRDHTSSICLKIHKKISGELITQKT